MALIKSDRVKETSTSTGATTFALAGAGTGYRTFSSVCAIGDTFYYAISNQSNGEWEAGLGTYSALNTLTRTAVHSSSNSGNLVTFSAGTKEVFLTLPARHLDRINDNGQSTAIGSKTSVVAVNDSATLPDLDLQFSELKTLTAKYGPTPSYSRASTGRYTNSSGVLTSAAVNEPRFDHVLENGVWVSKGLLIEEQRTNLCTYSEQFGHASWNFLTNVTVSSNAGAAPDGTVTADLIYPTASGANCEIGKEVGTVSVSSVFYTNSYYLKSSGKTWARILSIRGDFGAWFNLSNGTIGTTLSGSVATIQNVGNGWYRCTVARTTDFSTGYTFFKISDSDNSNSVTASGTNGILVWAAQSEAGSFSTSYIPTVASSVVRSADVCQITGSAFTNLWNTTEGTISIEQDLLSYSDPAADQRYFSIAASGNNPAFILNYDNGTSFFWYRYFSGLDQLVLPDVNSAFKVSLAFKTNDYATVLNGGTPVTSSTKTLPTTFERIDIGYQVGSAARSSWIQRLRYFRSRLDNTQLVNLSGGINTLAFKPVTGSGSVTVANEYSNINISVPSPLPITNGGTGGTTAVSAAVNLIKSAPNDGAEYTLKSKQISGTPSFYWVDSTGYAPTLDLLFAADKSLTAYTGPTPSFSRASTGTFFNSSGVLTTAAVNAPRFNHVFNGSSWVSKGLLVEEQRTNQITSSETFSFTSGSVTSNTSTAPNGTTAGSTWTSSVGTFECRAIYNYSSTAQIVFSCYAKSGTHNFIQLRSNGVGYVNFNISNGTFSEYSGATGITTSVGNGWYRCTAILPASTVSAFSLNIVSSLSSARAETFVGNGTQTVILWGTQLELGSFPTSYIPTTTAAVTRSADVCQITGGDFTNLWNTTEGSFAVDFDHLFSASAGTFYPYVYEADGGSGSNRILLFGQTATSKESFYVEGSGVNSAVDNSPFPSSGVQAKVASAYKVNDLASSLNGGAVSTDTSQTLPTVTRLSLGYSAISSGVYLNGHIARLRYYPTRLPNATLQVLST